MTSPTAARGMDRPSSWAASPVICKRMLTADTTEFYAGGRIQEVACWAHTRRYWWEARTTDPRRAHHALGEIARLYQIEATCADLDDEKRRTIRQTHALPILSELAAWLQEQ